MANTSCMVRVLYLALPSVPWVRLPGDCVSMHSKLIWAPQITPIYFLLSFFSVLALSEMKRSIIFVKHDMFSCPVYKVKISLT